MRVHRPVVLALPGRGEAAAPCAPPADEAPAPTAMPAAADDHRQHRQRRERAVGQAAAPLGGEVAHGVLPWLRRVTALDWIIVVFTVLMALWGYAQGLIVGALSLAGFAGGRLHRLAPRAAAARGGRPSRPTRRCSRWSARCWSAACWPRAWSCSGSGCATGWASGSGVLDGIGGGAAGGVPRARAGVDRRRGGAPDAGRAASCASRSSGRRSCASSTSTCRRRDRSCARSRASTRSRRSRARRPTCGPPDSRIARDPQVRAAGAQRGQGARHRVRARRAGQRLGRRRRRGRDQRPRGGRPGRHDRAGRRRGRRTSTPRRSGSTRATTSRCCARRAWPGRRRCGSTRTPGEGTSAAILGFPENGPYDVAAGAARAHRDGGQPGRLRARAGAALDHVAARPRALGQLGRARWSTAAGRVVTTIFAATVSDGGRSGYGVPDSVVADALGQRAAARSTPAPALGERGDRGVDVGRAASRSAARRARAARAGSPRWRRRDRRWRRLELDLEAPVAVRRRAHAAAGSRPRPRPRRRPRRESACAHSTSPQSLTSSKLRLRVRCPVPSDSSTTSAAGWKRITSAKAHIAGLVANTPPSTSAWSAQRERLEVGRAPPRWRGPPRRAGSPRPPRAPCGS